MPLKSVLLAAHLRVLSVVSGQGEVLTGLVSNGGDINLNVGSLNLVQPVNALSIAWHFDEQEFDGFVS